MLETECFKNCKCDISLTAPLEYLDLVRLRCTAVPIALQDHRWWSRWGSPWLVEGVKVRSNRKILHIIWGKPLKSESSKMVF